MLSGPVERRGSVCYRYGMPIYEYRCLACQKRTSVFVRSLSSEVNAACEHCGSKKLTRLISRVAVHRGAGDAGDLSSMDDIDENDPRAVARWARQMRDEMGEDMGPEFDEMVGRMEAGEMPDDIAGDGGFDDGDDDF
jgi:putative FmdB family regulatory protein